MWERKCAGILLNCNVHSPIWTLTQCASSWQPSSLLSACPTFLALPTAEKNTVKKTHLISQCNFLGYKAKRPQIDISLTAKRMIL